jgi:hypothetical protein
VFLYLYWIGMSGEALAAVTLLQIEEPEPRAGEEAL